MSRTNQDFLAEAAAVIPEWLAFLDRMEAEQDALLAQVRGPTPPTAGAAAPMSHPSGDAGEAIKSPESRPDAAGAEASQVTDVLALHPTSDPVPSSPRPSRLAERFGQGGTLEPAEPLTAPRESAPSPHLMGTPLPADRPESVQAFEVTLAATGTHELPVAVTDAMQWEQDDPLALPRALVAAQRRGELPPALDEAVTRMVESDFHFAEAADEATGGEEGVA